ncbi:chromosomal replication initiator protein DnaA [Luteipulveratus flavus]|uniref:Serine/threonine protein kinase n=1 Tax=Luteipulveratus flavus TaxID=3031728 RepID=A0ABT6C4T0_9MICO|nr:hypothetical protein [Luteipulveratus sp. YIM 133296]MDF8263885.1 hypothetical protein [Luteipulveratus sp. YIM 133296]
MSRPEGPGSDDARGIDKLFPTDDPDATHTDLPRVAKMPAAPSQPTEPGGYARGAGGQWPEPPADSTEPFRPVRQHEPAAHAARTQTAPHAYDVSGAPTYDGHVEQPGYADERPAQQTRPAYVGGGYDGRQYDGPEYVEDETPRGRGGLLGPIAVIALSVIALGAAFLFTRGGGDENAQTPPPLPSATAPANQQSPTTDSGQAGPVPTSPSPTPWTQSSTPPPATSSTAPSPSSTAAGQLPRGVKVCGPNVGASRSTTCPFAQNVAAAVAGHPRTGSFTVNAHSEATKKDYVMHCNGGQVTVCRGGKRAVVYIV